jgi:hypothetical protein
MKKTGSILLAALITVGLFQPTATAATHEIELTPQLATRLGATQFLPVDAQHAYRSVCIAEQSAQGPYRSLKNWTLFDGALARGHWVGEYVNGSWINAHAFVLYAGPLGGGTPNPDAQVQAGNPASLMGAFGASHYLVAHSPESATFQYRMYCLTEATGDEPLSISEWSNFDQARANNFAHRNHKRVLIARPSP